jgi:SAM-dependent methyltransferase
MSAFETHSPQTPLPELFDAHYLRFWRAELGERVEREAALVRRLGRFERGAAVLDVGCGFGRLTNRLAQDGLKMTGVDLSAELLEEARRNAERADVVPTYLVGDMRALGELGTFEGALLWFTSLGYFDDVTNARVLREARRCLAPGGRMLIETRHWDGMRRRFDPVTVRGAGADLLIEWHDYDPLTGVQHTRQQLMVGGQLSVRRSRVRRYGVPELRALCLAAGFGDVAAFDASGGPLHGESERCVVVAVA